MKKIIGFLSLAMICAQQAHAVEVQPYAGADIIYSFSQIKDSQYFNDRFLALNASVGAMLTSVVGLELSYQQSEQKKKTSFLGQTKSEYKAFAADGVYYYSVLDNVQLLGAAGLGYYEFKSKVNAGILMHKDDGRYGLRAAIGAQYNINENVAARLMFRYHYIHSDSLKSIKDVVLGARYYF